MAKMTAAGLEMRASDGVSTLVVALGRRVTFADRTTGVAHCWTAGGVMVVLDRPYLDCVSRLKVLAVNAGDGDLVAAELPG